MTDFEKYVASTEARKTTHGEHVDKLTGYFLAEANRTRDEHPKEPAQAPEPPAEPPPEPPAPPAKRVRWWQWWRH